MTRYELIRGRKRPPTAWMPDRREALAMLAAGSAAALAGCQRPRETITPFVDTANEIAAGEAVRYATALELSGYGRGVVGVVVDGRPIKVEGNAHHPSTLGATDPFIEAAVLDLFDPQRSKTPMRGPVPTDWRALGEALRAQTAAHATDRGAGIALLTGRVLSPTVLKQVEALTTEYPDLQRFRWEPLHDDAERVGAGIAFGRALAFQPRLDAADVVVSLGADLLGPGPDQIRMARGFARRRRPESGPMSRLYAIDTSLTPTGVMADRREAGRPELIHNAAIALAAALGAPLAAPALPPALARLVAQAAGDLKGGGGRGLVLVGPAQAPEIHALAHWMNGQARAPVDVHAPIDPVAQNHADSLLSLVQAMRAGAVKTLIVLDSDPVFGAPPELGFRDALRHVAFTVHAGLYRGATGRAAMWHAPLSHAFESWSDTRALDGTASLVQPLVAPLYDTRSAHAFLAMMRPAADVGDLQRVQATWRAGSDGGDFAGWWTNTLAAGVVPQSAATPATVPAARLPAVTPATTGPGLTLVLRPSPRVWDGRLAANAWLQETPDPISKETWGSSLALAPADAEALTLAAGAAATVRAGTRLIQVSVRIDPGHAQGAASLQTGFGQVDLGPVADGVGANAFALRDASQGFLIQPVEVLAAGAARPPPATQHVFELAPADAGLFPVVAASDLAPAKPRPSPPDLLTPPNPAPIAWAMVIDTSVCIGCNACVVACQAENNVPVIGPEEIAHERDMHWLRVDRYEHPGGQGGFQPVPCMQCEEAPCEPVCPVEASVHDSEGLNDQVYNRCIGTRFCESNCPYKVRRFNFHDNQHWPVFGQLDARSIEAQRNPEVSVRARGVMEKCTYCVQRISAARRTAEKEDRPIRDGEVTTACQGACPTQAISFGNRADPSAAVNAARRDPRHFVLLEELKTKPRTTYLARAANPPDDGGPR
jgi:molybdopterin-containing oxidoreductase family iron-sulfur binding subunit